MARDPIEMEWHKVVIQEVNFVCIGRTKSDAKTRVRARPNCWKAMAQTDRFTFYLESQHLEFGLLQLRKDGSSLLHVWMTREKEEYRKTLEGERISFPGIFVLGKFKKIHFYKTRNEIYKIILRDPGLVMHVFVHVFLQISFFKYSFLFCSLFNQYSILTFDGVPHVNNSFLCHLRFHLLLAYLQGFGIPQVS